MLDVEPLILEELRRLSPLDDTASGDWEAIVGRSAPRRRTRRAAIWAPVAAVVVLAVVIPALAFSGTVRSLVGLSAPTPRYDQARLRVEVRLRHDYVYRLWTAPSTQGGECMFTTEAAAAAPPRPKQVTGGGLCRVGSGSLAVPAHGLTWTLGHALGDTYLLNGVAGRDMHVARLTLRWHGGSQRVATNDGYFLGLIPIADSPPFRLLPFDLVAQDGRGRIVMTQRIPTSFLYSDWKHVQPKLRTYRRAHGCSPSPPLWRCSSR
jgi:hypothetical protein